MDVWRSGPTTAEVGFRDGYKAGFEKAGQGLVVTVPGGWRKPMEAAELPGGWWQLGWRQGWVAGCDDGWAARRGEERLEA